MSTLDQREEARYRQDVLASYRAWVAYLEAQQAILAAAGDDPAGVDPFEGMSAAQEQAEAAQRRLAALADERRALFDAVYAQERAQVQGQRDAEAHIRGGTLKRPDPDEVARQALAALLAAARGLHRNDRRGLLPRGAPDAVKWLAIDLGGLEHAPPSETDYQLAAGRGAARRGLILNLAFAALALIAIPVLFFLLPQPGAAPVAGASPTGNGLALAPWPIAAVEEYEGAWQLAVAPVTSRWPASCGGATPAEACWLEGSFHPVRLCLPPAQLEGLVALRLVAPDGLPARVFLLVAGGEEDAELVVSSCAGGPPERVGRLRALEPGAVLAPGEPAPAGFEVTAITARGRGEDPALPEGRLVLSVAVQDSEVERDWVALAPTLRLADGSEALPSQTHRDGVGLRFDYLVAEQQERFEALWQVSVAGQVVRYRAALEPPPSRDAVLRSALRVADLSVTPSRQTMTVRLTLHNAATAPLVVEEADLGFQAQVARRPVAAPALRQPLAPGERRAIAIDLPLESGELQLGPFRYQITVRG